MILFYLIVRARKEVFPKLEKKDYLILFIQSSTGILLYNILLFYGLRYTSGAEAGVILSLSPVFAAIAAFILLREVLSYKKWIGVALAVLGVMMVNLYSFSDSTGAEFNIYRVMGNLMIIGVALSEAIFAVTSKYNRAKLSTYQICLVITAISFILFLPLAIYESLKVNYSLIDLKLVLQMAYFIIFVGIIPYVLTFTAIKYISATTAGVLTVLIPISSIILSVIFLGDKMQPAFLVGSLVALAGVVLVTKFE